MFDSFCYQINQTADQLECESSQYVVCLSLPLSFVYQNTSVHQPEKIIQLFLAYFKSFAQFYVGKLLRIPLVLPVKFKVI